MELTSIDYARLIQYAAQKKHLVILGKTQVNKILFYVYGVYLAMKGKKLFNDDTPKAWTYGPVFPIQNKKMNAYEEIRSFPKEKVEAFRSNQDAMQLVIKSVDKMYNVSAVALTRWSHQEGSPWYDTVYVRDETGKIIEQHPWNTPISDTLIKEYFSNPANRIFGEI